MEAKNIFAINQRGNLLILGILGGVASGKSTISHLFQQLGAKIIDADKIGHEMIDSLEVRQKVQESWGEHLVVDNKVNRPELAKIVFHSPAELKKLEAIVHPLIWRGVQQKLQEYAYQGQQTIVLDISLLWECHAYQGCDYLIFVEASKEIRKQRAREKRHWPDGELEKRESFQASLQEKRDKADFIIENVDMNKAEQQVKEIWYSVVPGQKSNFRKGNSESRINLY